MTPQSEPIRLAVIDNDSGFVKVLTKRTEAAGWQHRQLASAVPAEELVAMKLNALVIDLAMLGEDRWTYLERVCGMLPDLGVIVCSGQSTVAQRVRALRLGADDWVSKPCHPEEVMARIEALRASNSSGGIALQSLHRAGDVGLGGISDQHPPGVATLLDEAQEAVDPRLEARLAGLCCGDRLRHPGKQLTAVGLEQGPVKLALRLEVLVDQRLRDPAPLGHVVEGGLVIATVGECVERGTQDRLSPGGGRHSPARPVLAALCDRRHSLVPTN